MGREAIPDDQERSVDVAHQRGDEFNDLRTFDGARIQPEIEAPQGEAGNH
jgi:hypothetical protein